MGMADVVFFFNSAIHFLYTLSQVFYEKDEITNHL